MWLFLIYSGPKVPQIADAIVSQLSFMSRSEKRYEKCRWFCRNNVADALRIPFRLHLNEPMWRAPILEGGWSDRFVSGREISKWSKTALSEKGCTVLSSLTPHGAKATLLSMAAKYGLGGRRPGNAWIPTTLYRKSAAAIYARDLHSAPLRKLERMLACIRNGSFLPDANRSGMLVEEDTSVAHPSRSGYNTKEWPATKFGFLWPSFWDEKVTL